MLLRLFMGYKGNIISKDQPNPNISTILKKLRIQNINYRRMFDLKFDLNIEVIRQNRQQMLKAHICMVRVTNAWHLARVNISH